MNDTTCKIFHCLNNFPTYDRFPMRSELMQVEGARGTRGKPRLTWVKVVRRDMTSCNLMADMSLNRVE